MPLCSILPHSILSIVTTSVKKIFYKSYISNWKLFSYKILFNSKPNLKADDHKKIKCYYWILWVIVIVPSLCRPTFVLHTFPLIAQTLPHIPEKIHNVFMGNEKDVPNKKNYRHISRMCYCNGIIMTLLNVLYVECIPIRLSKIKVVHKKPHNYFKAESILLCTYY